jgi:hypothetical protein
MGSLLPGRWSAESRGWLLGIRHRPLCIRLNRNPGNGQGLSFGNRAGLLTDL